MVEVFKTDVMKKNRAKEMLCILNEQFPHFRINFDLHDRDKILRVEGADISAKEIVSLLHKQEHICEQLL